MSKLCAKCEKIVYPTEEVKCLDKSWHKGCFRCWECGMALSMKNYKGYDKRPYCSAHYPQTKATVVADTPEQQRLARTSQMQSQAVYHADFEKNIRGTITSVTDDPETKRVKEVANVISQAAYTRTRSNSENPELEYRAVASPAAVTSMNSASYGQTHGFHTRMERSARPVSGSAAVSDAVSYDRRLSGQHSGATVPPNMTATPSQLGTAQNVSVSSRQSNQSVLLTQSSQPGYVAVNTQRTPYMPSGPVYMAMYDYDAQDDDEVSFVENDQIVLYEMIDEGWMYGIVKRTGDKGMIPANYVEPVQQ